MLPERYYLYVFSKDMTGYHELVKGKLFFDEDKAKDEARNYCDMVGYHAQVINCNTKEIVYEQ